MKNFKQIALVAFAIFSTQFYAQTKTGTVTYEMTLPNNDEMAQMGTNIIKLSFNEKSSATQVDMMGGMVSMKSITVDKNNSKDTRMLMDMMGEKYELIGEPNGLGNSNIGSLKDAESVTYDKTSTKEILGYKCYKATIKMTDGMTSVFYITEAIAPQTKSTDKLKLAGFPLEIEAGEGERKVIIKATAFDKTVAPNYFVIPEGYTKITQDELQQKFGM